MYVYLWSGFLLTLSTISSLWTSIKDFKIGLSQVGKVYIVSATLRNVFLLLLFFVDNYKWSTTKKHCLWGKLSTTKCENFKLSMTRSSLLKKESCSVVETNC